MYSSFVVVRTEKANTVGLGTDGPQTQGETGITVATPAVILSTHGLRHFLPTRVRDSV
jgi:hypothetical protein